MQGKALPVEVRNIIVGKWLNNEGYIFQYLIKYLVRYFSSVLQYFSWVLQYLIHQHANLALQIPHNIPNLVM